MYVYTCTYTQHTHTHTHTHTQTHTHTHTHTHTNTHTHTHKHIQTHIQIYAYTYISIYIHIYTHTHTHTCMYVCIRPRTQWCRGAGCCRRLPQRSTGTARRPHELGWRVHHPRQQRRPRQQRLAAGGRAGSDSCLLRRVRGNSSLCRFATGELFSRAEG